MKDIFKSIAQQLELSSYAVIENFLTPEVAHSLLQEIQRLIQEDELRQASIGKGLKSDVMEEIRKDEIKWLSQKTNHVDMLSFLYLIEELGEYLSQYFRVSIKRYEGHWAHYPPEAFYKKHVDQFVETNNRIFSVITYLNPNWKDSDGGELVIYQDNKPPVKIKPKLGSLVCFRSDLLFHEVLPTKRSRYSITGWYRKDELVPIGIN